MGVKKDRGVGCIYIYLSTFLMAQIIKYRIFEWKEKNEFEIVGELSRRTLNGDTIPEFAVRE